MDSTNADALYVRGLCLYYEDCIEKAVQFFVQALRMAPDHEKACLACRVSCGCWGWDSKITGFGFLLFVLVFFNQTPNLVLLDQSLLPPSTLSFPSSPVAISVSRPSQRQQAAAWGKTELLEAFSQKAVILWRLPPFHYSLFFDQI